MRKADKQTGLPARLTHRKAFTLVELLVVITIIGILFVVLISKVDFATEKAKAAGVQTDFRSYQLAIETVARENAGLSTLVDDAASGEEKYAALETALNKNLDPKLRIEIDADGKISTEAKDPWKEQYLGTYLAPDADGTVKDRGAIVMYCKGSNLKLGTTSETVNGVVNVTLESGKETEGADDYAISTIYTYVNGYGEIQTTTGGFSNDIGDTNNTPSGEGESGNVESDKIEKVEIWMIMGGETINMTEMAAENNATINTHLVDTLPDTMIQLDMENGIMDAYILKSTGIIYVNVDGTVITFGQLIADGAAEGTVFDKGWSEDIYSETEMGIYCVKVLEKPEIPVETNGGFYDANGVLLASWDELVYDYNMNVSKDYYGYVNGASALMAAPCYIIANHFPTTARVVISNTVSKIGSAAFRECTSLTSVDLGFGVKQIGDSAFSGCIGLTNIAIPEGVTELAGFGNCTGLTSVVIPDSVTSIDPGAFYGCSGLTSITIPSSVTSIGDRAFSGCSGLTSITISSSVTSIGEDTFKGCSGLTGALVIPEGVETIGRDAFSGCSGLTSVVIPDSVTSIDYGVFDSCKNLTSVDLGAGISDVKGLHFSYCYNLTTIVVDSANATYYSINNCVIERNTKTLALGCTGSIIPSDGSVTNIGSYAFGNSGLNGELIIPNGVTGIRSHAFNNCEGLTSVIISDSVTSIGESAFSSCKNLTSVDLGSGVVNIEESAFSFCGLTDTLIIPNSVVTIRADAFRGSAFTNIEIGYSLKHLGASIYSNNVDMYAIFGDLNSVSSISVSDANPIYHSDGNCLIETASKTLILGCKNSVIPTDGSVTSIGNYAFAEIKGFSSIVIPDSVTSIGDCAFLRCGNLPSITIHANTPPLFDRNVFTYASPSIIYVPTESVDAYKTADGWSEYADKIQAIPTT